jgi:hypothetical protein
VHASSGWHPGGDLVAVADLDVTIASIRAVPLAPTVAEAVARKLDGCPPGGRVFCGPGGSHGVPRGARSRLSTGNYRRVYQRAVGLAAFTMLDLHGPHELRSTYATRLCCSLPAQQSTLSLGPDPP